MLHEASDGFKGKNRYFLTFLGGIRPEPGFEQPSLLYTIYIYLLLELKREKKIYIGGVVEREYT